MQPYMINYPSKMQKEMSWGVPRLPRKEVSVFKRPCQIWRWTQPKILEFRLVAQNSGKTTQVSLTASMKNPMDWASLYGACNDVKVFTWSEDFCGLASSQNLTFINNPQSTSRGAVLLQAEITLSQILTLVKPWDWQWHSMQCWILLMHTLNKLHDLFQTLQAGLKDPLFIQALCFCFLNILGKFISTSKHSRYGIFF